MNDSIGDAPGTSPMATEPPAAVDPAAIVRVCSIIESLLFVAEGPTPLAKLRDALDPQDAPLVGAALEAIAREWTGRGLQLSEIAGGFQIRSNPANAEYVQRFLAQRPVRLSRAQLETLAIIAYRQPITRPEIDDIRGVDSGAVLKLLLDRSLIRILGKKEEPGRPMLYGTTREFLEFFNLRDLRDLPTLREFQELSEEHRAQVDALGEVAESEGVGPVEDAAASGPATELPGSGTAD